MQTKKTRKELLDEKNNTKPTERRDVPAFALLCLPEAALTQDSNTTSRIAAI